MERLPKQFWSRGGAYLGPSSWRAQVVRPGEGQGEGAEKVGLILCLWRLAIGGGLGTTFKSSPPL